MKRNQHKGKGKRGAEATVSGGGELSATLNQIVDYAKDLDDREEAERMELMCYRLFGRRLTPEAADIIAEIPKKFKKKNKPVLRKFVTINKGDRVDKKTVIPHVTNYNEEVDTQNNSFPMPQLDNREQLKIAE